MRYFCCVLVCAWMVFVPTAGVAADEAREAFEAGQTAFAQEDHLLALAHFQRARQQGMDGPAVHYNIGVCHYKLGEYRNAEASFELIADRYPAMRGLAQYNLGLVALKVGDRAHAERMFREALANSDDEKIRALAQRQLGETATVASAERAQWFTMLDARVGHDDNVVLVADDIPLSAGQSADSSFTELLAFVSGPLSPAPGFRFDGSLYAVSYADASFYDQNVLRAGGVYEWRWGSWRAEAGPHYSYSTLDGDAYERRLGGGVRVRRALNERSTFGIRYVHDEVSNGASRFAFVDGSRDWLELLLDHRGAQGRVTFAYSFETNDRADPSVSPARNRLSLRYRHAFSALWAADVGAVLRRSRYGDMAEVRTETLGELSGALTRYLPRGWQINAAAAVADNDSNVAAFDYDRRRLSLGVTKQF